MLSTIHPGITLPMYLPSLSHRRFRSPSSAGKYILWKLIVLLRTRHIKVALSPLDVRITVNFHNPSLMVAPVKICENVDL